MTSAVRKLRAMTGVYYALMVEYRAEIVLWAVSTSLPLIMMGVWVQAGASGDFKLDATQMARYFIAVFLIRQLSVVWVIHDFEWQVVSGRLSPLLLQPIDPAWRFVLMHVGEQLSRLPIVLVLTALCFSLYPAALWGDAQTPGWWTPSLWQVVLAVVGCYCAFVLRFLMQYSFAMGAFWFERVAASHNLIFLPYLFLSGIVIPLEELPPWAFDVVMWTPFPYMVWFPATILADGEAPYVKGFAVIAVWVIVLWIVNRLLWRAGLKHYSAMGA